MKKFLLILFIIILLGGCGLGGWYFLTTYGKDSPVAGLKLELVNQAKIIWINDCTEEEKASALYSKTEAEYLAEGKDELFETIEIKIFSFLNDGVVECKKKNSTITTTRHYIVSSNGKTISLYEDSFYSQRFEIDNIDVIITKDETGYWLKIDQLYANYQLKGIVVFQLKEVK